MCAFPQDHTKKIQNYDINIINQIPDFSPYELNSKDVKCRGGIVDSINRILALNLFSHFQPSLLFLFKVFTSFYMVNTI